MIGGARGADIGIKCCRRCPEPTTECLLCDARDSVARNAGAASAAPCFVLAERAQSGEEKFITIAESKCRLREAVNAR